MRWILGTDRETGREAVVDNNPTQYSKVGRKHVPSESNYISLEIKRSPFWRDLRVVDQLPEGLKRG